MLGVETQAAMLEVTLAVIPVCSQNKKNRPSYHYDGKAYHFEGADGECVYARVDEAEKRGNVIIMRGETYYPDHEDIEGNTFIARARPYKFNGKSTWAITLLDTGFHPVTSNSAKTLL